MTHTSSSDFGGKSPPLKHHKQLHLSIIKYAFLMLWIAIVTLIVCEYLAWPFLRAPLQKLMTQTLAREIIISEPFKLRLFGGVKLEVGHLFIAAPTAFNTPHFIDAANIKLKLRYSDLIKFKNTNALHIKALEVDTFSAQLLRSKNREATWQFNTDPNKQSSSIPTIETLTVNDGVAKVIDPVIKINLTSQFKTIEGRNKSAAKSSITFQGRFNNKPIKGRLDTDGFLPIAASASNTPPIPAKAWVDYANIHADFIGKVSDLFSQQNIKGQLTVKGQSLALLGELVNVVLPTTGQFSLKTMLDKDNHVWIADKVVAHIGDSDLNGQFRYDPRPEKRLLTGNLAGQRLFIRDLSPALGTKNSDGSNATPAQNHVIPDRKLDLPSLDKMDANIAVNLQYVDLGEAFSKPISPLKANIAVISGKLSLKNIDARTADGSISGLLSIDTHSSNHPSKTRAPTWLINLNWKNIDVEKWLKFTTKPQQATQTSKDENSPSYLAGTLNGKTNLTGAGNSTAQMLSSLNGEVSIYMQKGTISRLVIEALGLDIAQSLGIILTKDKSLPMQCAVLNLEAKNGIATPSLALVDTPLTLILMDGNINIAKETLDLRLLAKPKNISPLTVRSPIHITGTFKTPSFSIEKTPIVMRLVGSIALAFVNPLAAILPFLDTGSNETSPCKATLAEFNNQP
jgi:AsmA family protein